MDEPSLVFLWPATADFSSIGSSTGPSLYSGIPPDGEIAGRFCRERRLWKVAQGRFRNRMR